MTTRTEVVEEAYSWINTKFVHQARVKQVGVDCAGLVEVIAVNLGLVPEDYKYTTHYPRDPSGIVERILRKNLDQIDVSEIKEGSILFFGFGSRFGQHLGIYTGKGTFIHAYQSAGKVFEITYAGFWKERTLAAFDYRGLEDD